MSRKSGRRSKVRYTEYHNCDLHEDTEEDLLYTLPPNASSWAKYWQTLKRHIIVNANHPFTKEYFRSQTAIFRERRRHVLTVRYQHVVHPFSNIAKFRSVFMCLLFSVLLFLDPVYCTLFSVKIYRGAQYPVLDYVQLTLNFMVLFDIIISFFMGYAIEQSREVVLEPRLIAIRYLKSYFVVDVLTMAHSVIPLVMAETSTAGFFAKTLVIARLARIHSVLSHLTFTLKLFKLGDTLVLAIQLLFIKTVILHWWTCYFTLLPTITKILNLPVFMTWLDDINQKIANSGQLGQIQDHPFDYYLECLLIIMCHFYAAGTGVYNQYTFTDMAMLCLVMMSGVCFTIYAIALVSEAFGAVHISTLKYEEMTTQVQEYVQTKKLPQEIVDRLETYYEYKFQRRFFLEHAILNSLSEHLQMEVMLYSCKHLIEKVDIFKGMSRAAIGTILSLLHPEIYLPGDLIYSTDLSDSTYYHLISYGTTAFYLMLPDNTKEEFGHFEDGDHLGDTADLFMEKFEAVRCHTVAIETCEIYSITKADMVYCIKMFPELKTKIKSIMRGRLDHLDKIMATEKSTHKDILSQLQAGKILEQGELR